jgi:hypothetical protein
MKCLIGFKFELLLSVALLAHVIHSPAQVLTIQVGPQPTALVSHGDEWRYRLGSTSPVSGWQTNADGTLDATWLSGRGGFGYSTDTPAEVARCQTLLNGMFNGPTTLYTRRTFEITEEVDPTRHLILTMDWDDGFVAYLDGEEIKRSNVLGTVGVEPLNTATASPNHESGQAATYDLGMVGASLSPGNHVLSILGLNGAANSTDFVLLADLSLAAQQSIITGVYFSIVPAASVDLSGTNTIPGATRVLIDGVDATFNPLTGQWSRTQPLAPGFNRLLVQAVDAAGVPLFSTNSLIVSELSTTRTGGTLLANTTWNNSMGIIRVTNNVIVPAEVTLSIQPGTVVLLDPGVTVRASAGALIQALGTGENIVAFLPSDGSSNWGEIAADGAASALTLGHVETIGGAVKFRNGAIGLMENSYIHDYKSGTTPIAGCTSAQAVTVRGCHFRVYHETLWQNTLMTVEDCLFELANNPSSDALDFDGVPPGSVIRRCTFRHGPQSNTDAVDIGPFGSTGPTNTVIEDSLMYDFPNDKGVSIGEGSYGIVVRNCLIYGNNTGIEVKDSPGGKPPCTAIIYNCTIVNCNYGFHCFNKSNPASPTGGGQITNSYNNILWSHLTTVDAANSGFVIADHTDFAGGYPGEGNIDADPLFLDAVWRDYRLGGASPCIGSGRDGETMGAKFPVGAAMAPSHPRIDSILPQGADALIRFWVDSEKSYSLLTSATPSGGAWTKVVDAYPHPLPRQIVVTNSLDGATARFYRLVVPRQP